WKNTYMKQTVSVDTDNQVVIADLPTDEHNSDFPYFIPILKRTKRKVKIGTVLADRGYDSEENNKFVRRKLKADNLIRIRTKTKCRKRKGRFRKELANNFDWER
ncbi:MAG: transposase, partial [Candidatus Aenigmarchaeota archaeon]|nr:transposase [Candidatus Aenigmarchaeota archaeon]